MDVETRPSPHCRLGGTHTMSSLSDMLTPSLSYPSPSLLNAAQSPSTRASSARNLAPRERRNATTSRALRHPCGSGTVSTPPDVSRFGSLGVSM